MADILAVPLKKTSELDLIKPLKNIVSLRFSTADNPENFSDGIVELNKLRNSATIRTLDKQEASIEIIARLIDVDISTSPPSQTPFNLLTFCDHTFNFGRMSHRY